MLKVLINNLKNKMKMEETKISKANAENAYKSAGKEGKTILENIFPQWFKRKITDRVTSLLDAIEIVGVNEDVKRLLSYNGKDSVMLGAKALASLTIINQALNEGWVPDYNDKKEYKYYPWFEYKPGVGFSSGDCVCADARTCVGSRLSFKTSELAKYAGQQFESIYNDFLTYNK